MKKATLIKENTLKFTLQDFTTPVILYEKRNFIIKAWNRAASNLLQYHHDDIPSLKKIREKDKNKRITAKHDGLLGVIKHTTGKGQEKLLQVMRTEVQIDNEACYLEWLTENISSLPERECGAPGVVFREERQDEHNTLLSYRRLFENVPGMIYKFHLTPDKRPELSFVSSGAKALLGIEAKDLTINAQLVFDTIHPDDLGHVNDSIHTAIHAGLPWVNEFRITMPNGQVKWIAGASYPYREEEKEYWYGFLYDITERKLIHQKITESELKNSLIIENSSEGILFTDAEGKIFSANPQACEIFGRSEQVLCGMNCKGLMNIKNDRERFKNGLRHEEIEMSHSDGTLFMAEVSSTLFASPHGEINGALFIRDISKRKKAEDEIKRLARIASLTSNLVIFTDTDGRITWVNDGFERITEFNRQEVIGKKPGDFLQGAETSKETVALMHNALDQGKGFNVEILNYSKSGRGYWIDVEAIPMHNERGELTGFMAIESDITDLKNALKEMQRSEQALQAFMDHAPMHAYIRDLKGRYTFYNKMYATLLDKQSTSTPAASNYNRANGENSYESAVQDKLILDSGNTVQFEETIDGQNFLEYKFPLRDAYNRIFAIGNIALDITEKIETQRLIKESEERYRTLVSDINIGVLLQGPRTEIYSTNQAALDLLGITEDQLLGRTSYNPGWNVTREDGSDFPSAEHPVPQAIALKKPLRGVVMGLYHPLKGERVWLLVDAIPRLYDDGTVKNVICTFNDITRLKEAQSSLQFTRFTIDHTSDAIYWIRPDGSFADMNPAAHTSLGYTLKEMAVLRVPDIDIEFTTSTWNCHWQELRERKTMTFTSRQRRKDGSLVAVEVNANFIVFMGKEFNCSFVRDITDRKKYEQALLASNLEKDTLIKEIHHRVKNNLQLISSILYIKLAGMKESATKEFLKDTRQKIKSIALIHERFLQTGSLNQVDIAEYLGKLIIDLEMSNTHEELKLTIQTQMESELMGLDAVLYYGLIITELVTNAIKHAFTDCTEGTIYIELIRNERGHQMIVRDNGSSMPEGVEPGKSGSFGMQLLDIFIKQLNGQVAIDRTRGTTFTFLFQ